MSDLDPNAFAETASDKGRTPPPIERGYYEWVPLAEGELPPEEEEIHPAATMLGAASLSLAAPPAGGRGDLGDDTPLPLAGGVGGGPVTDDDGSGRPGPEPLMTPEVQGLFLGNLQLVGNVSIACSKARISRMTAYRARRRSPAFARAWDAALLAARVHAEAELADRAINGVEEAVFYHGEEVARRRRYDSRLLLAHLGRLDKLAEREELVAAQGQLDDWVDALARGEAIEEVVPVTAPAGGQGENDPQDSVTGVTGSPSTEPCPDCGGACLGPEEALGSGDCRWLGNRLDRMDAERPDGVPDPYQLGMTLEEAAVIEERQLAAFEAGEDEWWCVGLPDEEDEDSGGHNGCG